jgi:hypothetical protein
VEYISSAYYVGPDQFNYKANDGGVPPEGGDSNTADVFVSVFGVARPIYTFPLDSSPGWSCDGQWAFGQPTGGGSWNGDPYSGHTGDNVYGYNLDGDYENGMPERFLTSPPLDCSLLAGTELRFRRWLCVEATDGARIETSTDGVNWSFVWANNTTVNDTWWTLKTYNISSIADGQPTVYIRWCMGPTDGSFTLPGWNLDDIEIWGVAPEWCRGDSNCSGAVDFADIEFFVAALSGQASWEAYHVSQGSGQTPACPFEVNDLNGGGVEFTDVQPFIQHLGQPCDPLR